MRTISSKNHSWTIKVEVADILRLKSQGVMDLTDLSEGKFERQFEKVFDFWALGSLIGCLCSEQIAERDMTFDQFFGDFTAEQINATRDAIVEELIDFFRKSGSVKEAVLVEKVFAVIKKHSPKVAERIRDLDLDPIVEAEIEGRIQSALSGLSGKSPDGSE